MPTMNISLTHEMAAFVSEELATGDCQTASELVREALRALRRDREIEDEKTAILKREVGLAAAQVERGEFAGRSVMEIAADVLKSRGA